MVIKYRHEFNGHLDYFHARSEIFNLLLKQPSILHILKKYSVLWLRVSTASPKVPESTSK